MRWSSRSRPSWCLSWSTAPFRCCWARYAARRRSSPTAPTTSRCPTGQCPFLTHHVAVSAAEKARYNPIPPTAGALSSLACPRRLPDADARGPPGPRSTATSVSNWPPEPHPAWSAPWRNSAASSPMTCLSPPIPSSHGIALHGGACLETFDDFDRGRSIAFIDGLAGLYDHGWVAHPGHGSWGRHPRRDAAARASAPPHRCHPLEDPTGIASHMRHRGQSRSSDRAIPSPQGRPAGHCVARLFRRPPAERCCRGPMEQAAAETGSHGGPFGGDADDARAGPCRGRSGLVRSGLATWVGRGGSEVRARCCPLVSGGGGGRRWRPPPRTGRVGRSGSSRSDGAETRVLR